MSFEGLSSDYSWLSFLCVLFDVVLHDRDISRVYSFNSNDIHVSNICFNDACLHTLSTVYLLEVNCVKFILEFACFQGRELSRNRLCTVGFTITSGDVTGTGVGIVTALAFPLIMQCRYAMCFSGIFSPVNTEETPRGSPVSLLWIHNMISALAFSFCVIFDVTVFSTYSGYIRPRYNESLW